MRGWAILSWVIVLSGALIGAVVALMPLMYDDKSQLPMLLLTSLPSALFVAMVAALAGGVLRMLVSIDQRLAALLKQKDDN